MLMPKSPSKFELCVPFKFDKACTRSDRDAQETFAPSCCTTVDKESTEDAAPSFFASTVSTNSRAKLDEACSAIEAQALRELLGRLSSCMIPTVAIKHAKQPRCLLQPQVIHRRSCLFENGTFFRRSRSSRRSCGIKSVEQIPHNQASVFIGITGTTLRDGTNFPMSLGQTKWLSFGALQFGSLAWNASIIHDASFHVIRVGTASQFQRTGHFGFGRQRRNRW